MRNTAKKIFFMPVLIFFVAAALCACSRGDVFVQACIDDNGSGSCDAGEKPIMRAGISMSVDGKSVAESRTDDAGFANFSMERGKNYCFKINETDIEKSLVPQKEVKPKAETVTKQVKPPAPKPCADINPKDLICDDCDDENANMICDDMEVPQTGDEGTDAETEADTDTETETTTPVATGWTDQGFCKPAPGGKHMEVQLALKYDFSSAISDLPEPSAKSCSVGKPCEISILAPAGCVLKPLYLPEGLKLAKDKQLGISFDPNLGRVVFDLSKIPDLKAIEGPSISTSKLTPLKFNLEVSEEAPIGSTEVTIQLTVKCGSDEIKLPKISITLLNKVKVSVSIERLGEPKLGGILQIKATIENSGDATSKKGKIIITLPTDTSLDNFFSDETCKDRGKTVECPVPEIVAGDSKIISMGIKMPDSIEKKTTFSFDAIFTSEDLEEVVEKKGPVSAESIEFDLKPPADPTP